MSNNFIFFCIYLKITFNAASWRHKIYFVKNYETEQKGKHVTGTLIGCVYIKMRKALANR